MTPLTSAVACIIYFARRREKNNLCCLPVAAIDVQPALPEFSVHMDGTRVLLEAIEALAAAGGGADAGLEAVNREAEFLEIAHEAIAIGIGCVAVVAGRPCRSTLVCQVAISRRLVF